MKSWGSHQTLMKAKEKTKRTINFLLRESLTTIQLNILLRTDCTQANTFTRGNAISMHMPAAHLQLQCVRIVMAVF